MSELITQPQDCTQIADQQPSIPEPLMYKNRLQEYTQKSSLNFPVYSTINEGNPHAPRFRSTVLVDGTYYTSQNTFLNRKAAEQDVARIALENIPQKPKDEDFPLICEDPIGLCKSILNDTVLCKSILNEYAVKMNLGRPSYTTRQAQGLLPIFVCDLTFNGVTYTGDVARNKRDAERLAAHAAVLSILDSESRVPISEIIMSKSKLHAALHEGKTTDSLPSDTVPVEVSKTNNLDVSSNKRKEVDANEVPPAANLLISEPCEMRGAPNAQGAHLPFHEFKKPKDEASSKAIAPPIIFVPPVLGENLGSMPCSTSGKKKKCRNKKRKAVVGCSDGS